MILVLCHNWDEARKAAETKVNEIAPDGPVKQSSSGHGNYGVESLTTGDSWHFLSTDSPKNARYLQGRVYASYEGEIPNEFWREWVLLRIRAL